VAQESLQSLGPDRREAGDADTGHALMERVGQRLRAVRAGRGMTRRSLAADAEVSERYLAEIETGKANLSLQVLCRIAEALGLPPLALLEEERAGLPSPLAAYLAEIPAARHSEALEVLRRHFDGVGIHRLGVALIGLRGAGKSTLGRRLADEVGCPFVCLTDLIQELGGMRLDEIFSLGGQRLYRRLEREALEQAIAGEGPVVLETGGSLVSEAATYARLLEHFHTVWVRASPEEHMQRVVAQGDMRPMHGNREAMEDLRRILSARGALYAAAHAHLDTSGRKLEESLRSLKAIARDHLVRPRGLQQA